MAFTINRNNEISKEKLQSIKERFKQRTYTQAICQCIDFVYYSVPHMENEIQLLKKEVSKLKNKYNYAMHIIKLRNMLELDLADPEDMKEDQERKTEDPEK